MIRSLVIATPSFLPGTGRGTARLFRRVVEGGAVPHICRHAELASASIPTRDQPIVASRWTLKQVQGDERGKSGRLYRFETQTHRQIAPMRVVGFDQVDFPVAVPVLQLFFARYGGRHVGEELVSDKPINGMARRKAFDCAGAVLVEARDQVGRHADVKRSVMLAGEDVDAGLFGHRFSQIEPVELASRWTLKQVQGDGGVRVNI
jgi:hypothetical protein